jgi:hypothetical protein
MLAKGAYSGVSDMSKKHYEIVDESDGKMEREMVERNRSPRQVREGVETTLFHSTLIYHQPDAAHED